MSYISIRNKQIYYETVGKGSPVLMVMGLGGNSQVWAPIRRFLAKQHTLIMYDMQGTGRSTGQATSISLDELVEEIEAVRTHLNLEMMHGIGYSFGATVLLNYASRFPDYLSTVSLVSGMYEITPYARKFFEVQAELATVLDRSQYLKQIILWLFSEQFFIKNPEFFDRVISIMESSPLASQPFEGWKQFSTAFKADYRQELSGLRCPTQLIHGTADKVSPVEVVTGAAKLVANCQLDLVEQGGHMLTWDNPETTTELLLKFLETHSLALT